MCTVKDNLANEKVRQKMNNKNTKPRIEIYDTTLRDGAQTQGVSFTLQDKLLIAKAMDELGVDVIEGGYPLSNPKDEAFFHEIPKQGLKRAKVAAFGMTRRRGVKVDQDDGMKCLLASQAPIVTIVGKAWDMHVHEVLRISLEENLEMISQSIELMVRSGREVVFDPEHSFDGYRANREYFMQALLWAVRAGAKTICLCDTNGGSLPEQIAQCVDDVRRELGGEVRLGIHCHNDGGLAVANTLAAVLHGCSHVQGTINGIGERCGNADLTAVIPNLMLKYGYFCLAEGTLANLTEISRFVYEVANLNLREYQPFVGSAAFAHKGGMHAHAVARNTSTYEHVNPAEVGNSRRILVSEVAGVSNIAAKVPSKFKIADDRPAQKKILNRMMAMENEGYQFEAAEASFEVLVRKELGEPWYRPLWELDHYRCTILRRDGADASTEATIKLTVAGQVEHTVAEGNGPVDSLCKALIGALVRHYPAVKNLHLVDYKVRVVNTAAETAAKVRVVIDWHDKQTLEYFGSVGVSENIIDASWLALVDAFEYKQLNLQEAS